LKIAVFSIFFALVFMFPHFSIAQSWDSVKKQFIPEDVAERPPEVSHRDDFEDLTFTQENFYNKSAGTRQYRRSMMAPTKSMEFEVVNPLDQKPSDDEPTTKAHIIEKDGKAVTVISIGEDSESKSE